ncbi:MAG: tyrosine--tRNA ligase [Patescibacteria group bacterium]|nr:tyrosine--tRNA ligase [Patescibacteria group bacterium]
MAKIDEAKIQHLLNRGVENIFPTREFLEEKLRSGKKLTIYMGIDPTGDIHIGHSIPLRKLKEFQDLGHKVIVLIGDFTAQIGDPTDKTATRVKLTRKQVLENAKDYKKLIGRILDFKKTNIRFLHNEKWTNKLKPVDMLELMSHFTVSRLLERDMFQERIKQGKEIYLHEFVYPVFQAYDSVTMDVDGEIGGNDQMFNMLAGRTLMKKMLNKEKFVITTKLLEDPTGKKMGKTEGNIIALSDSPEEMFGKVMSWTDGMILPGLELLTDIPDGGIKMFADAMKKGENPRNIKFKLAHEVVEAFYDHNKAEKAGEVFNKQFQEHEKPQDMEEKKISDKNINIVDLVFKLELATSKSEARRLVEQGAVRIDDLRIEDSKEVLGIHDGMIVQVGKRKFVKIKV